MKFNSPEFPFKTANGKAEYYKAYDAMLSLWPIQKKSRILSTFYGSTHVHVCGPETAAPLILLPGAAASSPMWGANVEALANSYRIYAVDIIGDYGKSVLQKPIKKYHDYCNWLGEVIDQLKLEQINIAGFSYGGAIATHFALDCIGRVSKLVIISPAGIFSNMRIGFIMGGILTLILPFRSITEWYYQWPAIPESQRDEHYRLWMKHLLAQVWMGKRHFKQKMLIPASLPDESLKKLTIPTLFLIGEQEVIYSPHKAVQRANKLIPQITAEIIPNASHDITFAQSKRVSERILQFL